MICIATLPWIALLALSVSIEFVSSSARVTSVKSAKGILSLLETSEPIDRTPGTPGSDKNWYIFMRFQGRWYSYFGISGWSGCLTIITIIFKIVDMSNTLGNHVQC